MLHQHLSRSVQNGFFAWAGGQLVPLKVCELKLKIARHNMARYLMH